MRFLWTNSINKSPVKTQGFTFTAENKILIFPSYYGSMINKEKNQELVKCTQKQQL